MPAVTSQLNDFIMPEAATPARSTGPGFFARAITYFHDARVRQAEKEIADLISRNGGRLTDSLEREIARLPM